MAEYPEVMTLEQAAAYLQLGVTTLYNLARRRAVPVAKIGRQWRFHKAALDAWLTQGTTTNETE